MKVNRQQPLFYTYLHRRLDTNEVFYVGMGRTYHENRFYRAYTLDKRNRNSFWLNVYKKCKDIEIIIDKKFTTLSECLIREESLIKRYGRKIDKSGSLVNISPGYKYGGRQGTPLYQFSESGLLIQKWLGVRQVKLSIPFSLSALQVATRKNKKYKGFYWSLHPIFNPVGSAKNPKKVMQIDSSGCLVEIHNSVKEASLKLNISDTGIFQACTGKRKTSGGFNWKYKVNNES